MSYIIVDICADTQDAYITVKSRSVLAVLAISRVFDSSNLIVVITASSSSGEGRTRRRGVTVDAAIHPSAHIRLLVHALATTTTNYIASTVATSRPK